MILVLHNIRSVYNVGAIFRTADAVGGVEKIILSGYTPTPLDRFGRPRKDLAKIALGAEQSVPWEAAKTLGSKLNRLKEGGYTLIGLEQDDRSVSYDKYKLPRKAVLIVGNEVKGLSKSLRDRCDDMLEIPMRGEKESLNVSVATGIALYTLLR